LAVVTTNSVCIGVVLGAVCSAWQAQSDGTKQLLKDARHLATAYNESLTLDAFVTLLDFAYLAVHNGDLDSRDNVSLRALYDWSRHEVAFPALERGILSGHDADREKRSALTKVTEEV
jgi:hypothetical protein